MGNLTVNTSIAFTFAIKAMPTGTIPTNVSLIITDDAGVSTFDLNGTTIGAVYTAPTTTVDGSYTFNKTFTTPGTWKITLVNGTATAYTVLHERFLSVIQGDTVFVTNVTFPV